jgi:hypothetical protein
MEELTIEEKAKRYDEAIERAEKWRNTPNVDKIPTFANRVIDEIFLEFKESEDDRIRKALTDYFRWNSDGQLLNEFSNREVRAWLEKQGTPAKLSEEEQNRFAKGVLTSCAMSFINYLDAHKYEGKMCVSNGECEDIENAFHNAMWDKLHRYYCKYIEKQGENSFVNFDEAEKEKYDFVSGQYIQCRASFNEFKEGNSYWLEYIGNDTYIGRSDNILNQKFHITPRQLYRLFTQQHFYKEDNTNEETNAPTGYGKYVDECLNEAAKHFFSEGEDTYSVADLFYAGVRCGKSWLEKQGSEPNWYHHKVDLSNCSEEYRKAYYDGWNNCSMQYSQCKSDGNDVVKCLINGMKFYYEDNEEATWGTEKFSMKVKDILSWLEKQGENISLPKFTFDDILALQCCMETVKKVQEDKDLYEKLNDLHGRVYDAYHLENQGEQKSADKVEPKFKVGDWIANGNSVLHITNMDYGFYQFEDSYEAICIIDEKYHLWTIQDAKDGDVLAAKSGNRIFLYNGNCDLRHRPCAYCGTYKGFSEILFSKCAIGNYFTDEDVYPATKKQRNLLFQKMKESGYEWDAEKKELKEIEQKPTWSEEDEKIRKALIRFHKSTIEVDGIKGDDIVAWLEKQGEKDKLIKELGEYKVKYTQEVLKKTYK